MKTSRLVQEFNKRWYMERGAIQVGGDRAPSPFSIPDAITWMGVPCLKNPCDLWMYQELVVKTHPDIIVETGTGGGGTTLFLAHVQDAINHGRILSIDIYRPTDPPYHPRIKYLMGSSTSEEVVAEVRSFAGSTHFMVILDSDHDGNHVLNEMFAYSPLLNMGDYLIVEDTNLRDLWPDTSSGPAEAVKQFLSSTRGQFEVDRTCERLWLTFNPRGYLRRVGW